MPARPSSDGVCKRMSLDVSCEELSLTARKMNWTLTQQPHKDLCRLAVCVYACSSCRLQLDNFKAN